MDLSIITYGMGVHWAKEVMIVPCLRLKRIFLILRTLLPWDQEAVMRDGEKKPIAY